MKLVHQTIYATTAETVCRAINQQGSAAAVVHLMPRIQIDQTTAIYCVDDDRVVSTDYYP